jgi:hypothetical protein
LSNKKGEQRVPPGGIHAFLKVASENEKRIVQEYSRFLEYLDEIDGIFRDILFEGTQTGPPLSALLYMNAYGIFLAAVRTACSGQSPPVYMILRGALESAAYALIAKDPQKEKIYLARDRNAEKLLRPADPNLADFFRDHYDSLIDFGGHPNVKSVKNHLTFSESPDFKAVTLTILHDHKSFAPQQSLLGCIEVGLAILLTSPHVFPEDVKAVKAHQSACDLMSRKDKYVDSTYPEIFLKP